MFRADVIKLIAAGEATGSFGECAETQRTVYCEVKSVSRNEFYMATAQKLKPEIVFVLADYADYANEPVVEYNAERYTVIRTYRTDSQLELVCQRRTGS